LTLLVIHELGSTPSKNQEVLHWAAELSFFVRQFEREQGTGAIQKRVLVNIKSLQVSFLCKVKTQGIPYYAWQNWPV
jgi:hypothetical protein